MRIDKVRSGRNYDRREASLAAALYDEGVPSKTVQSEKDNCDINVIVRRFNITGSMPPNARVPNYGDFMYVSDYHTAMQAVRDAQESFMLMPADVRSRFGNDPQQLLEFCSNPDNYDEAVKLGLAIPRESANIDEAGISPPIIEEYSDGGTSSRVKAGSGASRQPGQDPGGVADRSRVRSGEQARSDRDRGRHPDQAPGGRSGGDAGDDR